VISVIRPEFSIPTVIVPLAPHSAITPPYETTSSTTATIANFGLVTFAVDSKYLAYTKGARVRATSLDSNSWMDGTVESYAGRTLILAVDRSFGSGTFSNWNLNIVGESGSALPPGGLIFNAMLVESHENNSTTFELKLLTGENPSPTDPVTFITPLGVTRSVVSAMSLTISAGASLGITTAKQQFRLWFVLIDDAGTIRLGVIQCRDSDFGVIGFPAAGVLSAVANPAGSAGVFYANATVSSKPFAVLGFAEYDEGLLNAANWTVSPSRMVLHVPGSPLPGDVINDSVRQSGDYSSGSSFFEQSDTPPTYWQGDTVLEHGISPKSSFSVLEIDASAHVHPGTNDSWTMYVQPWTSGYGATSWTAKGTGYVEMQLRIVFRELALFDKVPLPAETNPPVILESPLAGGEPPPPPPEGGSLPNVPGGPSGSAATIGG
jgi:hypothetical protein